MCLTFFFFFNDEEWASSQSISIITSSQSQVSFWAVTQHLTEMQPLQCLPPHATQTVLSLYSRPRLDPSGDFSPSFTQTAVCFCIAGDQIHPEDNQVLKKRTMLEQEVHKIYKPESSSYLWLPLNWNCKLHINNNPSIHNFRGEL